MVAVLAIENIIAAS